MFHVPRFAGNHPRIVLAGLIALVLLVGAAFVATGYASRHTAAASADAADVAPPPRPPVVVVEALPQLAARLRREAEAGRFMGGVLVMRGDDVLFRQVYGVADADTGAPLALNSRFRLASLSKQVTAAAILRLQDDGVLSVDDPVCRWIQPCPAAWAPLRIHHLISHTSGIPDLMQRPGWGARRTTPATMRELTEDSAQYGLSFVPGEDLRYNNAGFNLAADIVERASGMAFGAWLQSAFFDPLGMADTGLGDGAGLVAGHATFPEGLTPQRLANVSIIPGAGALYSTLDDMRVWQRALHAGRLLSAEGHAAMIADYAPPDQGSERGRVRRSWGYGLMANRLGRRVEPGFEEVQLYHTGSWSGFRNLMSWQPGAQISVIVLSNNYHQQEQVFLIAQQAMAEALGHPFPGAVVATR
ncbi:serine hydrolase domain-containing protein [Brevundimonas aurifodinae]|uniref:Serine hydrolase domain-containing protein n=2 Tax=Brevundimonas TaxID=41275 RepID=A0ABV1NQ52_9CAUL|nr:MAG: serine hydrolase [Brevundimonas sp. 12-68-7]OYX33006.1 MAG: serine hydrolase [Brevundimonas subvibrioides]